MAVALFIETLGWPAREVVRGTTPPYTFPRLLCVGLALCSIGLIYHGIKHKPEQGTVTERKALYRVIAGVLTCSIYAILMGRTEFFIYIPLGLILPVMLIMGVRSKRMLILIPLIFALTAYFVFAKGLGVMFPTRF